MSRKKRAKPLYQRGSFALHARPDRPNLEIVWYDGEAKRERSCSTGTSDVEAAKLRLDKKYRQAEGRKFCSSCGQRIDSEIQLVTEAITDFLTINDDRSGYDSMRYRLARVASFVIETDIGMTCAGFDEEQASKFRAWIAGKGLSPSTAESSLVQLAAAIRETQPITPLFTPHNLLSVNATPQHRSEVSELAAMFRYALTDTRGPKQRERGDPMPRENLLRYLRAAVATLARPDAIHDISTAPEHRQWNSAARALNLNPHGRRQTRKRRAYIPIAKQFAKHLDATDGIYLPVASIRTAWETMRTELKLPGNRESGWKLPRRSMASLVRDRIGEANYAQVKRFMGHAAADVTDIYALAKPEQLGIALAEIEKIIDEIEALAPGAYRINTAKQLAIRIV